MCATERCVETLSLGYREDSVCRDWAIDRARGWTLGSGFRAACLAAAHVGCGFNKSSTQKPDSTVFENGTRNDRNDRNDPYFVTIRNDRFVTIRTYRPGTLLPKWVSGRDPARDHLAETIMVEAVAWSVKHSKSQKLKL